jgi:hypothetical protein
MLYPLQKLSIDEMYLHMNIPYPMTLQTNDIDEQCIEPYFEFGFNGSAESTFLLYYAQTQKH